MLKVLIQVLIQKIKIFVIILNHYYK